MTHSAENDAQITEAACQRLRGYVDQHEGMCWCGFDSEGVNGEGETLDHVVHSLVSDWLGFLAAAARPIPPGKDQP